MCQCAQDRLISTDCICLGINQQQLLIFQPAKSTTFPAIQGYETNLDGQLISQLEQFSETSFHVHTKTPTKLYSMRL